MPSSPGSAAAGSVAQRMGRAALIVAIGIALSRILGFVRQMVLSGLIGASGRSDEYFVAFGLPDFMNYLVAGAFLSITFIPIFTRRLADGDEDGAWEAFAAVFRIVSLAIVVLVVIGMFIAEPVVRLIQPGFTDAQVLSAARMTRIVLPAQAFLVMGSLLVAVQYAKKHFLIPTLAPIFYNLGIIVGGVIGAWLTGWKNAGPEGFAWGVLAGAAVGNFGIQWWGARRVGARWTRGVAWGHPAVGEYFRLAIPIMVGQGILVLDEQLGRSFGSLAKDAGTISWLQYARRAMLVPVGIVAQGAAVAAYPFLSQLAEEGKLEQLRAEVARALRYVLFLSLGIVPPVALLARPIVRILFERGRFGTEDALATATVLGIFALAIPLWGIGQMINRAFYARRQMWTVALLGTAGLLAALPLYWILLRAFDYVGLALASVLGLTLYVTVASVVWFQRTGWSPLRDVGVSVLRALFAMGVAAAVIHGVHVGLHALHVDDSTLWGAILMCVVAGGVGGAAWLGSAWSIRAPEVHDLVQRIRRRFGRRSAPTAT